MTRQIQELNSLDDQLHTLPSMLSKLLFGKNSRLGLALSCQRRESKTSTYIMPQKTANTHVDYSHSEKTSQIYNADSLP